MLINGNFESTPLLTGWTTGYSYLCTLSSFISSSHVHSPNHAFHDACIIGTVSISQSFAAIAGQVYNVTFWLYLTKSGWPVGTAQLDVTMN